MNVLNLNIGLLGHVDSGKTSLAKALSEVSSTAAFDKNPQSQERGITLDLGFSSFTSDFPSHIKNPGYDKVQFTLVDCPGHASLMKTIIGGAHIIDLMVLVIDASKGIQPQASECIVICEIIKKRMIIVVNKMDLLEEPALVKITKKLRLTIDSTAFKGSPIVTASALNNNVRDLVDTLLKEMFIPERNTDKPFLFAVDHCFGIKGKGTVLTGTILEGCVKINDDIEIPSINLIKKVKSIEMFKKPVDVARKGDRVGICVTQFNPKLLERGIASKANHVKTMYAVIVDFRKVPYYSSKIESKSAFHINVGYENTIANLLMFDEVSGSTGKDDNGGFSFNKEYKFLPEYVQPTERDKRKTYVLLEFSKPILVPEQSLVIGAKLDAPVSVSFCRIAFYGHVLHGIDVRNYQSEVLKNLKIFKEKMKKGIVERRVNDYEVIGKNMFKKETNIQKFAGMKVTLSSGEEGVLEGPFGQSGKFKVRIPGGLKADIETAQSKSEENKSKTIEIYLHHKRYMFDPNKKMFQN